jgi:hypothetical protein
LSVKYPESNFYINLRNDIEINGDMPKSKRDLLRALEMLEKANETKGEIYYDETQEVGFFGRMLRHFKCGK